MPKIFLGISILLITGSAVLGFLTKGKVTELRAQESSAQDSLKAAKQEAEKLNAEKESDLAKLAEATKKAEQAAADVATKQSELEAASAKLTEVQGAVAAKDKEIEELKAKPAAAAADPAAAAELVDAKEKLVQAETQLAEAKQVAETITAKLKQQEADVEALRKDKIQREQKVMAQGLEGQVVAVNQAWNFVVLNLGDKQGVVMNAELIIRRGADMIGRVKISSVEPTTAIGDIVPGSLQKNVRVQPGDRVIYTGS